MNFEEWWEKETGDNENNVMDWKGFCKSAFEAGLHADIHTDNSKVIAELEKKNAELEAQICSLEKEEKELFLSELGLDSSGLDRLISECYSLFGLISYLTAGKQEVRAWTITKGTKAPQAAGKIHCRNFC